MNNLVFWFLSLVLFTLWGFIPGFSQSGSEWPQFRGPTGQGIAPVPPVSVPLQWTAEDAHWKTKILGSHATAAVAGNHHLFLRTTEALFCIGKETK